MTRVWDLSTLILIARIYDYLRIKNNFKKYVGLNNSVFKEKSVSLNANTGKEVRTSTTQASEALGSRNDVSAFLAVTSETEKRK